MDTLIKLSFYDGFPLPVIPDLIRHPVCETGQPNLRKAPVKRQPAVYILASKKIGTLYIGVTSDLVKRIWEHKNDMAGGFTKRYGVHQLVWYELHEDMESAILLEKRLKNWKRSWKLNLIEKMNPDWDDLYDSII